MVIRYIVVPLIILSYAIIFHGRRTPFYGDEPHYMMTVVSIIDDFDLNGRNQFEQSAWLRFSPKTIAPQYPMESAFYPPEHGFGFPALIALPFALVGLKYTMLSLALVALATVFLVARIVDMLCEGTWLGTMAALTLGA